MTDEETNPEVTKLRAEISTLRQQLSRAETDPETAATVEAHLRSAIKQLQDKLAEEEQ
ncbi:hypothetical protein [uncultured Agrococcus sp.]|uniref:hypothetical protein n=1 Tax=uncultured Agrococcus sp. TaxID=382258 RepID=UPI0025E33B4D|nr:hypothetical protein [uncultured Agrococcus sp.]